MLKNTASNVHLILRNTDELSGTPRILRRQARALSVRNHKVCVISDNFHQDLITDPNVQCLKTYRWPRSGLFQRHFFNWQAQRQSQRYQPALVIGHGDTLHQDILFMHTCVHKAQDLHPSANAHKKNASIPFHREIFEKGSYRLLVCNSKMMKEDLSARFKINVPTYIIYPGHDPNILETTDIQVINQLRQRTTGGHDRLILGVITSGNLENRGAFCLIRAIAKLPKEVRSRLSLLVVGNEKHPEKLQRLATEVGLTNEVHWMKPRSDVGNLISSVDIVVHAAKMEAFGMSVLEAMAFGKPIISTTTVGCSELFSGHQADFIIEKQDPDLLASALAKIIPARDLQLSMGNENARTASRYTWDSYDRLFLEIVEKHFGLR